MVSQQIQQPLKRSNLRKFLGKEYFIFRRRLKWFLQRGKFAKQNSGVSFPNQIISHQSVLLRKLRNVDMHLQHNKIQNLTLAIAKTHQVVIKPGQTFSIWQLVGRPTKAKGYLPGLVLHNGQTGAGVGGGLCQLGNLLYWMALHTPLTIKERWGHSYDVFPDVNRTIPFACGATLSYNYIDLQLENNTTHNFQIELWLTDTHLHGSISTDAQTTPLYQVFETDHIIQQQVWGGYTRHNKIWRNTFEHATKTQEIIAENHAIMMYSPLIQD